MDEALANIDAFQREVAGSAELQARLGRVHAWYAKRGARSQWVFAPSKFVGYRENSAAEYLRTYNIPGGANGGESEATLKEWFQVVDPDSRLGRELAEALVDLLARFGKAPRQSYRVNVPAAEFADLPARSLGDLSRITTDPRICGGRPCIKGTRMRVSDLVDMLAAGATREEILEDFPYIADEDIGAALAYAARAADHRVIRAA